MNPIMQFFTYAHLPEHLRPTSEACGKLAEQMDAALPDGPEKSAGLRKLLEAKDCFVRANLAKALVALVAIGLAFSLGCALNMGDTITSSTAVATSPTAVPAPGVSATPTPSSAAACSTPPASVRLGPFGYDGCTPIPANNSNTLPAGCIANMTATPKDAAGNDYPDALPIHTAVPIWSFSGPVTWTEFIVGGRVENFNRRVQRNGAGAITVQVSICNVVGSWTAGS